MKKTTLMAVLFCAVTIKVAQARYYDPGYGRFLTPDTIVQSPYDPQTLNRYTYVRNNPLIFTDPTGNSFFGSVGDFFSDVGHDVGHFITKTPALPLLIANPITWAATSRTGQTFAWNHRVELAATAAGIVTGGLGAPAFLSGAAAGATAGGLSAADAGTDIGQGVLFGAAVGGVSAYAANYVAPISAGGPATFTDEGVSLGLSGGLKTVGEIAAQGAVQGAGYGTIYSYAAGDRSLSGLSNAALGGAIGGATGNLALAGAVYGLTDFRSALFAYQPSIGGTGAYPITLADGSVTYIGTTSGSFQRFGLTANVTANLLEDRWSAAASNVWSPAPVIGGRLRLSQFGR